MSSLIGARASCPSQTVGKVFEKCFSSKYQVGSSFLRWADSVPGSCSPTALDGPAHGPANTVVAGIQHNAQLSNGEQCWSLLPLRRRLAEALADPNAPWLCPFMRTELEKYLSWRCDGPQYRASELLLVGCGVVSYGKNRVNQQKAATHWKSIAHQGSRDH